MVSQLQIRKQINAQKYKAAFVVSLLLGLVTWQHHFVINGFLSNTYLNGAIICVFLFGACLAFHTMFGLRKEEIAFAALQEAFDDIRTGAQKSAQDPFWRHARCFEKGTVFVKPSLLGHVYELTVEELLRTRHMRISLSTMESMVSAIMAKMVHERALLGYITGLLVFLGLIGTFIGLMEMVGSVGGIIGGLANSDAGSTDAFKKLLHDLEAPLVGMATGFSASLFGLFTSLVLGLLTRFVASGAYVIKEEFEAWLTNVAQIELAAARDNPNEFSTFDNGAATALSATLGTAAQGLERNAHAIDGLVAAQETQKTLALATFGVLERLIAEQAEAKKAITSVMAPVVETIEGLRQDVGVLRTGIEDGFGRAAERIEGALSRNQDALERHFIEIVERQFEVERQIGSVSQRSSERLEEVIHLVRTGQQAHNRRIDDLVEQQSIIARFCDVVQGALEGELGLLAQTVERVRAYQDDQVERLNSARHEIIATLRGLDARSELKEELRSIASGVQLALATSVGDLARSVNGSISTLASSLELLAERQAHAASNLATLQAGRVAPDEVRAMTKALEAGMASGFTEVYRAIASAMHVHELTARQAGAPDVAPASSSRPQREDRKDAAEKELLAQRRQAAVEEFYATARRRMANGAA